MGDWSLVSSGGTVDIDATYGMRTTAFIGSGMPPLQHNVTEQALIPGAILQGIKVQPRVLQLRMAVQGTSVPAYHSIRKSLLNAFKPNTGGAISPVQLRYTGAGGTVDTYGYYESGLEGNREGGAATPEILTARFICYDPFWYVPTATNVDVAEAASVANADYAIKQVAGVWSNISTEFNNTVSVIIIDSSGNIYLGGLFTDVGSANGDYIVKVAASNGAITALGTGANLNVYALVLGADGTLYAGGAFTAAGGVANTDGVAKWDGANWTALGTGISGGTNAVNALCIDRDGNLYAGGGFTAMGGVADTAYIAKWNGSAWSALGTGMNGYVYGLTVGLDGCIYAVGAFSTAGGVAAAGVAKWNGSTWSALGGGLTGVGGIGYTVAVGLDGSIYAGGDFNAAGGVSCVNIAKWNGSAWSALGSGLNSFVYRVEVDTLGLVHAGGAFTAAGGIALSDRYAVWNGSTWTHAPVDLPGAAVVRAIAVSATKIYLGYDTAGTATAAAQTTVANGGTAPAYPVITIARTGGTTARLEYLKNETTGQVLYFNYSLQAGETLTVTLTPGAKAITSNYFGNVIGRALLPNSDFATWCLQPGNNTVSMYVYQVGSPTITTTVSFNAPHFGADGVAT